MNEGCGSPGGLPDPRLRVPASLVDGSTDTSVDSGETSVDGNPCSSSACSSSTSTLTSSTPSALTVRAYVVVPSGVSAICRKLEEGLYIPANPASPSHTTSGTTPHDGSHWCDTYQIAWKRARGDRGSKVCDVKAPPVS
jgi:hypothetical protein